MVSSNPKSLFAQIFSTVYSKITGIKRGLLYKTIQIIVGEEQSLSQTETKKICDLFGIKPNASKSEDKMIIDNLLDEILINNPMLKMPAKLAISNFQGENMEWIFVAAAFTIVGIFVGLGGLDRLKDILEKIFGPKPPVPDLVPANPVPVPHSPLIPADLCLVVPASIASNFVNRSNLKVDELIYLIDNASYFLCTTVKVADSNEQLLKMTDETILSDSTRDVYIRININDGRNMIDQDMRKLLKDNLPIQSYCTIKQLACLDNLSGLEKFNSF